jgi:chromate transporter
MAGVTWQLGRRAVVDVPTAILFAAALVVLLRYRINSAWVIGAGALAGALISLLGQS